MCTHSALERDWTNKPLWKLWFSSSRLLMREMTSPWSAALLLLLCTEKKNNFLPKEKKNTVFVVLLSNQNNKVDPKSENATHSQCSPQQKHRSYSLTDMIATQKYQMPTRRPHFKKKKEQMRKMLPGTHKALDLQAGTVGLGRCDHSLCYTG